MEKRGKEAWFDAPSKPVKTFESLDRENAPSMDKTDFKMSKDEENSVLFLVGSRMASTGAHGIPNIQRASNLWRRLIWVLLFCGGVSVVVWQVTTLIITFFNFGVDVNIDYVRQRAINFPAVTVCNLNPVPLSKTGYVLNLAWGNPNATSMFRGLLPQNQSAVATQNQTTTSESSGYQDWGNVNFDELDSRVSHLEVAQGIIGSAAYENRSETGHDLDDMLLDCDFENYPCTPDNFSHFYNYLYGNCYTFNSGEFGKLLTVSKVGPLYGLSLELYIQQSEYISSLQPSAGLRLLVHDQNEMPFPEDQGINLAPGAHASVGLSMVYLERLGTPYTNCSSRFKPGNIFKDKFHHLDYSRSACEKDCYFNEVMRVCGCADVKYNYNDSATPCDSDNVACVTEVENNYTSGMLVCGCTMPCRQHIYEITVSEASWPNMGYTETVERNIEGVSDDLMKKVHDEGAESFISNNVLKVTIFYESLQYEYIYQTAAYGIYSLISDLGGQIGLWIGVSILTIFEFIELVYDLIKLICLRVTDPHMKKKRSQNNSKQNNVMSLEGRANSIFGDR
ncbi:amiloride-sensitive sodium channel subunit gamma-like isoform X2 [Lytechinus variegatus]|uniref:amiloride-sensitive sodium channel subunit gamma-like isoform X2 n=1 Tax=Lytechinus variegatus TaxID=7654 RepID=UPI001BB1AB73|nr:amiloride-sensitive sodium channel subunit gamma-like isoform X2 [Lytechinus variegatus]